MASQSKATDARVVNICKTQTLIALPLSVFEVMPLAQMVPVDGYSRARLLSSLVRSFSVPSSVPFSCFRPRNINGSDVGSSGGSFPWVGDKMQLVEGRVGSELERKVVKWGRHERRG